VRCLLSWEERRQLVKIASLYYIEGYTQEQISKKVGVSRPVISKHLQKAKDHGIVEVFIKDESLHTVELEKQLEDTFELRDAVVVPNSNSLEMDKKLVGQAAANYVSKNSKKMKKIGISWGTTLAEFVKEYPYERREQMKIVPLAGGMGSQYVDIHANQLAYELAKKMNASCSYLYVPAFVESEELKQRLVGMNDVRVVLEEGESVDMALVGLGNPYRDSILKKIGYLTDKDIDEFQTLGAVGDISSRFVDINGKPIKHQINNRIIGITLEALENIQFVIGVATGMEKVESVLGALNSHYLDVIIIDESTAAAVLERVTK
jgi:DNA-binding transcriptional regulator LsrR (DeoR family)